jgi:hypothetical protein
VILKTEIGSTHDKKRCAVIHVAYLMRPTFAVVAGIRRIGRAICHRI